MQPTKDTNAQRKRMFAQLLRKKRQRQATILLDHQTTTNQKLALALNHTNFGVFFLTANKLDKAQQHLLKSKDILQQMYPCSNLYLQLGNLAAQKRQYPTAIKYYQKAINISPYNPAYEDQHSQLIYSAKLNSFQSFVDAHNNISVMFLQTNNIDLALKHCQIALQHQPNNTSSQINFADFLRQLGQKQQAIDHTWHQIVLHTQKHNPNYQPFKPITILPCTPNTSTIIKQINVLCVKWGTRYPAAYVNKLYGSIKRNTTWKMNFYCFTDNPQDLNPDIIATPLQQGWKGWWGKVTLFGLNIPGRKFYIDLDMVITGSMDQLFEYNGQFATLRTDDLVCQKNHKGGYNSSVMIWQGNTLQPVYHALQSNFDSISKFIVRFDFWLEMTIANADILQLIYPGKIADYLGECQQKPPATASIVCFARKPKPEDYPAEWIKHYWVQ